MTAGAPREHRCSFCGLPRAELPEHEFVLRSGLGGEPALICSQCIAGMMEIVVLHRRGPAAAAEALAALKVGYVSARHEDAPG